MKTKSVSNLEYIFAVGRIRALENFLIKSEVFEEAIESDLGEALRLFVEADLYSEELLHVKDSRQLEDLLAQELSKVKKLVSELILDKELLRLLDLNTTECAVHIVRNYPSKLLKDYLLHVIDMHNIKSFLRLYVLKEPREKLETEISCEGFIRKKDFLELYDKELTAFLNRLEYVHKDCCTLDYTYSLGQAIDKAVRENSFIALEKSMNDFLINVLKAAKYLGFGPEPVLAYYFAKANEIGLIRMIILAKLNNVSAELLKERLNSVYA
ncbi:MAG: V-type ATPase subunit [Candidatus Omnitrophica bacterium]|nr:V-type ATPase subunit [Candidatus Omnitrophota bacterium]MDD5351650.1 V-type ATPase subunit [Candidatus Omnitrophota bacterium]MDD5550860.1 V-type ATPase subunit [Candidatus Omnitrophota bacterium]